MPQESFEDNIFSPHIAQAELRQISLEEVMLVGRPKLLLKPIQPVITYYTTILTELLPRIFKKIFSKRVYHCFKKHGYRRAKLTFNL